MVTRFAVLLAALFSIRGCDSPQEAAHYPAQDDPCALFSDSIESVTVALGIPPERGPDQTITVPVDYLDSRSLPRYREGRSDGSVLLYVRNPDFAPYPLALQPDGLKEDVRPFMRMLLQHPFSLNEALGAYSENPEMPLETESEIEGLTAYAGIARRDLYVAGNGETDAFFLCDPESCRMWINESGLGVDLGLDRALLPDWRRLSGDARTFANCLANPTNDD